MLDTTRWTKLKACMLSGVMLAGGCGSDDTTTMPQAAPPSAVAIDINPMPRESLQDGGTFTYPLNEIPPNFNYFHLDGTLQDNAYVIGGLMPAVANTDGTGAPVWNLDLLTGEPELVTEPQQIVTYEIRPDAAWYDDTPITWEDFHWQWRASSGQDEAYIISTSNGYEDIASVERGSHDREVVVTFARPYADWTALFSPIFRLPRIAIRKYSIRAGSNGR